jgi:UDP-N-acetylmuramyl pentapeptide phosphotransferase/UDP-N-acetylglucosamine-1-phosphate transferase
MEIGVVNPSFAPLLAGIVSIATMFVLTRIGGLPLDAPNARSLHHLPVPRSGGIAIVAGVVAAALWLRSSPGLMVPTAALAVASYLDDRHALSATVRLIIHFIAAGAFLWMIFSVTAVTLFVALLLGIAWITNLFNFMDGSDGLAGGMAVFGFGAYGMASWLAGNSEIELLAWSIAGAAAGFLAFNFPPAKIFMGDVGSIPLGFLAATIGVAGWQAGVWPLWFPLIVFAPFIVDASVTLLRRLLRGERVWEAHREHYYQRLILSGWSHRRTALWEYAMMFLCGTTAVIGLRLSATIQIALFLTLALCIVAVMWAVDRRWKRFRAQTYD